MARIQAHTFTTSAGYLIHLDEYGADLSPEAPVILYLHGFKGFKNWGFAPFTGEFFAEKGIRFYAMNFSHNGVGEDFLTFSEPEMFRRNTISLEIAEAQEVAAAIASGKLGGAAQGSSMGLIGHSRGGGVALISGSRSPHIVAITSWNGLSTFDRYDDQIIAQWKADGERAIVNSRTGEVLYQGWPILQDILANRYHHLSVEKEVRKMTKDLCVIQGDADVVVTPDNARSILEWAGENFTELHIIPNAGHTFNVVHPFAGSTPELDAALEHTHKFFQKALQNPTA